LAATALDAGQSVVIDAVHLRPEERVAAKQVASRSKAHFTGLWLEGPINTLMERIAHRVTKSKARLQQSGGMLCLSSSVAVDNGPSPVSRLENEAVLDQIDAP
jgi:hypothetical protein